MLKYLVFALVLSTALAAEWKVKTWSFATICCAVACTTEQNCLAPSAQNGGGSAIYHSQDFGVVWENVPHTPVLIYLSGAAKGKTAVVGDELNLYFSYQKPDGTYNFTESLLWGGMTSQGIEALSESEYAAAGEDILGKNGVAITTSGGLMWTMNKVSVLKTESRYVAIPSAKVIYLSAGEWPETPDPPVMGGVRTIKKLTQRFSVQHLKGDNGKDLVRWTTPANPAPVGIFKAQIVKSVDGGKTWVSQFYDENSFYFNEVDCGDENNCCAIGEADEFSTTPGVRIYCTKDGGAHWNQTFFLAGNIYSGMALRFVTKTEAWATGGDMKKFTGYFWHTSNAGDTWERKEVPGVYANDLSCITPEKCMASAFDFLSTSSIVTLE